MKKGYWISLYTKVENQENLIENIKFPSPSSDIISG